MKTKKCYLVSEYGDRWEDFWTKNLRVFLDKNEALKFKKEKESLVKENLTVKLEEFEELVQKVMCKEPKCINISFSELINKYYPEYNLEELQKTEEFQERIHNRWEGITIEELELCL